MNITTRVNKYASLRAVGLLAAVNLKFHGTMTAVGPIDRTAATLDVRESTRSVLSPYAKKLSCGDIVGKRGNNSRIFFLETRYGAG
jgi:hypothetical protein